ncbi:hypothetical protein N7462_001497 [Penicillium macrosclerotiorum]|uniref:uncharacterized protein n=1 Tax=Penicillium macrosclerotiorum TaxID=303699 RepID=UPI00254685A3|nr:uncharacterized protein N7462_001497 [Penicillium macrosclerotiorum]KAJ5692074.1 hypothetical protein N7462_001497 [Penicillium macrosclerotiorum]
MPPAQVDPDLQAEIDYMILDYLACFAINRILNSPVSRSQAGDEELNWQVESVQAFQFTLAAAKPEASLPQDLDIKLRLLSVGSQLQSYKSGQPQDHDACPSLSSIGVDFMNLCSTAASKVSETRWFDAGARFVVQATLEEQREGRPTSEQLSKLRAWVPENSALYSKWAIAHEKYTRELPNPDELLTECESLTQRMPFPQFKAIIIEFLVDLMITLDPPILLQLERGKLGQLSRAETQRLKERAGLR